MDRKLHNVPLPAGYHPKHISVTGNWDCGWAKTNNCCFGVEASVSRRSRWVLSPVWSRSTLFWTARVLGTPSVEQPGAQLVKQELGSGSDTLIFLALTYSSSPCGTRMFISELLALTMSQSSESLLRYTWQPSVLLMEMVGTLPNTCRWQT